MGIKVETAEVKCVRLEKEIEAYKLALESLEAAHAELWYKFDADIVRLEKERDTLKAKLEKFDAAQNELDK